MKVKTWLIGWFVIVFILMFFIALNVYKVDPFFHYHKPQTEQYFYSLDNERSQNDGICKHFDYDAIITGTSMTENFKTSEMNEIFGVNSIKVPFAGGSYKEINDNLEVALKYNKDLKIIIRGLDYYRLLDDKDKMRQDLGEYPTYLYDNNPFNDVKYLYNKDVIFGRVYQMFIDKENNTSPAGITSFDAYGRWQDAFSFGKDTVIPNGLSVESDKEQSCMTDDEKKMIYGNITQNVTDLADKYSDTEFYYFFTPYSAAWWGEQINDGNIYKYLEAEKYAIELILEHDNIHLFSFNLCTDITTDLNNYKDTMHYGEWINSFILQKMYVGEYELTDNNYEQYIDEEELFYINYDYSLMNEQIDYEDD